MSKPVKIVIFLCIALIAAFLAFFLFSGEVINEKSVNNETNRVDRFDRDSWLEPGRLYIIFESGTTESEARAVFQSYNLNLETFYFGSDDGSISVPKGKEEYWIEILKEEPIIVEIEQRRTYLK